MAIALLGDPSTVAYRVARSSAQAKRAAFRAAGIPVRILDEGALTHEGLSVHEFFSSEQFKIVQRPFPDPTGILSDTIRNDLDLCPARGWSRPAVCVATKRLVAALNPYRAPVAVVGAKGFFGGHLVALLQESGFPVLGLDLGDDLTRLRGVDFVATVAGPASIVGPEHLKPEHRVFDLGYFPMGDGFTGNVSPLAAEVPLFYTPVPGGMGPMQMCVLLERYLEAKASDRIS